MATLEDTVKSIVQDFIKSDVLFTALDVSNAVKQAMPYARHREVRDLVRGIFTSDIESQGWARTPIQVSLEDGTTAEALLYHPLTDSWDLDTKYDTQRRASTSTRPAQQAQAAVSAHIAQTSNNPPVVPVVSAPVPVAAPVAVPAPVLPVTPMPTARALWDQMFKTQPSLFPKR